MTDSKELRKCKAEFETLLEVSESRLREIDLLKLEVKEGISIGTSLLKHNKNLKKYNKKHKDSLLKYIEVKENLEKVLNRIAQHSDTESGHWAKEALEKAYEP